MTQALHKLLYRHVEELDEKAKRAAIEAEEDRKYLENNEDFLYFTVNASAWGYDMDAEYTTKEMGLSKALASFKRGFEREENGPNIYKGEWGSCGRIKTFHVYVQLAHSVVELSPSLYRYHLPKEMKSWVKEALDYKARQEKERRSRFG